MSVVLLAMLGGLGALARDEVGGWVRSRPAGSDGRATLVVNVTGSFALGFVSGPLSGAPVGSNLAAAAIGFLGGFTTFSTWTVASVAFSGDARSTRTRSVARNVAVMLVGGILGLAAGIGMRIGFG